MKNDHNLFFSLNLEDIIYCIPEVHLILCDYILYIYLQSKYKTYKFVILKKKLTLCNIII